MRRSAWGTRTEEVPTIHKQVNERQLGNDDHAWSSTRVASPLPFAVPT